MKKINPNDFPISESGECIVKDTDYRFPWSMDKPLDFFDRSFEGMPGGDIVDTRLFNIDRSGASFELVNYLLIRLKNAEKMIQDLEEENIAMYGALLDASMLGSARATLELSRIALNDSKKFK